MEAPVACASMQFFLYHFLSEIFSLENYFFSWQFLYTKQANKTPQMWGKTQ